jgi:photosystem II stability/assembly factor-like uncharacterized protein
MRGSLRPETFTALAIDGAGTLYALAAKDVPYLKQLPGVIKSTDGGRTWHAAGLPNQTAWELQVDPGDGRTVYAATNGAFFESRDGGGTWRNLENMANAPSSSVVSDPHDPKLRFGIGDGVVKSLDGGRSWAAANRGLVASGIYSLVLDPGSATTLFAADLKSVDGGRTWRREGTGLGKSRIEALALAPHPPGTLYAGTAGQGLFQSTDAGASWNAITAPPALRFVTGLGVDPELPGTVYAVGCGRCTGVGNVLFKTADGGQTWRQLTLPDWGPNRGVQVLAIDPKDPNHVFAGTNYWFSNPGLYRSSDGGSTWHPALTAPGHRSFAASNVLFDPRDPDNIYVSSHTDGILKSNDGGKTWTAADMGLSSKAVVALAIVPAHPRTLYASTGGVWTAMPARVFRSTDGARTWHSISAGLPAVGVEVFAIETSGRTVYAGTGGDGVIRLRTRG